MLIYRTDSKYDKEEKMNHSGAENSIKTRCTENVRD